MTDKSERRVVYFDVLNVLACIAVLALHHNGIVHWFKVNTVAWKQALIFEVLFYWAVPIFFMLSGATLLNYREKYSTYLFFSKRVTRAVIPFLLWSFILLFHSWYVDKFPYKNLQEVINAIFQTKLLYGEIYWFFIPLLSLYCLIPVLSLLKDNKKILWYIVSLMFVTHSVLPLFLNMLGIKWNQQLSFPMMGYVIFLILGYLLSKTNLEKKHRIIIYSLAILCVIYRYIGTYHFSLLNGKLDRFLFGYVHFHSVILAVAVFIFVKEISNRKIILRNFKIISFLSSCSLGVYLIHKFVMGYELNFLRLKSDDIIWRTFGIAITYFVCVGIVFLIKKIPFLGKHIV